MAMATIKTLVIVTNKLPPKERAAALPSQLGAKEGTVHNKAQLQEGIAQKNGYQLLESSHYFLGFAQMRGKGYFSWRRTVAAELKTARASQ